MATAWFDYQGIFDYSEDDYSTPQVFIDYEYDAGFPFADEVCSL